METKIIGGCAVCDSVLKFVQPTFVRSRGNEDVHAQPIQNVVRRWPAAVYVTQAGVETRAGIPFLEILSLFITWGIPNTVASFLIKPEPGTSIITTYLLVL